MLAPRQPAFGPEVDLPSIHGLLTLRHASDSRSEAIIINAGRSPAVAPVVRVQSSCVFSESFGVLDCDCADQLNASLELVAAEGVCVIYVYEEGRGAGLAQKFRAVRLQQDDNLDTAVAFRTLGMPQDLRDYELASGIIKLLFGDRPIVLLTNDPRKVSKISDWGIEVAARRSLIVARRSIVVDYLEAKAHVLGHVLDES
jgi:GTP cyclohydrolase II